MSVPITVGDVLALPAVEAGHPVLLCGATHLDRPVRWVHVFEGGDPGALLNGGELLLTTLLAVPDDPEGQRRYLREVARAGAVGVVIELGRRFAKVPDVMVHEADAHGLPVVALRRVIRFVTVTEAVHARILDEQHELLTFSHRVHEVFTEVAVEGAGPEAIVARTAEMAGCAVVLENLGHQVVAHALAGARPGRVLEDWAARSRDIAGGGAREVPEHGWLITDVGSPRGAWGRLVLVGEPAVPPAAARMLLERAAQALAVAHLMERDVAGLRGRAMNRFLRELLRAGGEDETDLRAAAQALGLAAAPRYLTVCVAPTAEADRPGPADDILEGERRDERLAEEVVAAARAARLGALAAPIEDGLVAAVLAVPSGTTAAAALARLVAALDRAAPGHVVGAGHERAALREVGADLAEAAYVARAAALSPGPRRREVYRLADIRIRGLLLELADDARLTRFAERELGPLLAHDARHGTDLLRILRGYLESGGNVAHVARDLHLSRQALYARLRTVERVLGAHLGDAETRTSLHVALLAQQLRRTG